MGFGVAVVVTATFAKLVSGAKGTLNGPVAFTIFVGATVVAGAAACQLDARAAWIGGLFGLFCGALVVLSDSAIASSPVLLTTCLLALVGSAGSWMGAAGGRRLWAKVRREGQHALASRR